MKNKKSNANKASEKETAMEKSLKTAIEQMAQFLRAQIKPDKEAPALKKTTRILPAQSLPASFQNSLEQIAQLLRKQVHAQKKPQKREWKARSSSAKKNVS